MDIKAFSKACQQKAKEIDRLLRRTLPVSTGNIAKRHFQENFRRGGFVNDGLKLWDKTKRQLSGDGSAASQHGPLLSTRNNLYSGVRYDASDYRVRVFNDVPYAPTHNWGATVHPNVTPKMRRYAWAKFYEAVGQSSAKKKGRKRTENAGSEGDIPPEAKKWRQLALTKKTQLSIKIPQRQFIGESRELNDKIQAELEKRIEQELQL